ncbi:MAG: hypothetical protein OXU29_00420, partial [Gammaproteobacteria bacterium]|nr:hypothetical protein [Gammaproteobacteria bacterium]
MAEHAAATLTGPGADMSDPGNGRVIIRPGDVVGGFQATFPITIADDSTPEPTEEFIVAITGYESTETVIATGLNTGPRIVIAASDQPAGRTLTVTGPASITETDSNAESSNYTIALTGMAFSSATTVTWTVSHGTTVDADFVAATDRSGTVSFAASDTSQTFTLTIAGDDLNEAAETFSVQVSVADATADGGTAYGSPATTTITDDDTLTATLSGGGDSVAEGADASLTVTLSGATHTADVVFNYDTVDATGSLTLAPGTTTGTLTITAMDDTLSEDAETFTVDTSSLTAT